jgi:hypothetical protein
LFNYFVPSAACLPCRARAHSDDFHQRDCFYVCQKKIIAQRVRNHTFELNNFYGEVPLAYPEYLKVTKSKNFSIGMAVNPDTEKVAPILPNTTDTERKRKSATVD